MADEATGRADALRPAGGRRRLAVLASHFADYSLELAIAASGRHDVLLLADPDKLAAECDADALARARGRLRVAALRQRGRLRRLAGVPAAAAQLAAFRPHVLIAHEHAHPHVTRLQRGGGRHGRLVLVVHDPRPHAGRDRAAAEAGAAEIAAQRGGADVLVAHGPWCAQALRGLVGPAAPILVVPHGPVLRPPIPVRPPPGGRRVLMFGRMEAYKGLPVLLEAFRRLAGSGAALELVGDGPELARLEPLFRGLRGVEVERGYASRARLQAALARADLVVAPYTEATQSGVVAAAFANGRPVLASAVGGLPDAVADGVAGRLIPPGDPERLAQAIRDWPERSDGLWRGALEASRTSLSWAAVLDALEPALWEPPL